MSAKEIIIVKKNVKRPSGVRAVEAAADLSWIAHLHKLWAIPRDRRRIPPLSA